jgi:hypothetical protein
MTHLVLPHASALSDAAQAALRTLRLPQLDRLLARLRVVDTLGGPAGEEEYTLSPPHEALLARLRGWTGADGAWPVAAAWAQADGVATDPSDPTPWGLVTPVHWQVGSDAVTLIAPGLLELSEAESRALCEALQPSFEAEGWQLLWAAPLRWYARHASLGGLPLASLDRAVGRSLDLWLGQSPEARRVRRLQVEAQMLWHEHPVNEAREAARHWTVNSFWLSGCGAAQAGALPADVVVDDTLRDALLAGDWARWVAAWQALDAGPIAALAGRADAGEPVRLSLCGERVARTWAVQPQGLWGRLRLRLGGAPTGAALTALGAL